MFYCSSRLAGGLGMGGTADRTRSIVPALGRTLLLTRGARTTAAKLQRINGDYLHDAANAEQDERAPMPVNAEHYEPRAKVDSGRSIGVDGDTTLDLHHLPPVVPQNDADEADNGPIDDAPLSALFEAEPKLAAPPRPTQEAPREIEEPKGAALALALSAAIDDAGENFDRDALIAVMLTKFDKPLRHATYGGWISRSTIAKVLGKAAGGGHAENITDGDAPHIAVHEERVEDVGSSRGGSDAVAPAPAATTAASAPAATRTEDQSHTPRAAPPLIKLRPTTASHLESLFHCSNESGCNYTLVMTMAPLFTLIEAVLRTTEKDPAGRHKVLSSIRSALGRIATLLQKPTSELRNEMLPHRWRKVVGP